MEFRTESNAVCSQQPINSSDEIDEWLDLDRPLTFAGFQKPSRETVYSSQLITPIRKEVSSDIDSGLDFYFSSSDSNSDFHQKNANVRYRKSITQGDNSNRLFRRSNSIASPSDSSSNGSPVLSDHNEVRSKRKSIVDFDEISVDDELHSKKQCADNQKNQHEEHMGNISDSTEKQFTLVSTQQISGLLLSEKIRTIYSYFKENYSDCSFVYAVAAQMCQKNYPMDSHVSLKLALLLSIVSCNNRNQGQPISIIAISRDTSIASSIMRHIGNCAKRFITISDDLKYNGKTDAKFVESNSLMLAQGGVCYIGDWLGLKQSSLTYLQSVLDTDRIIAETSSNTNYQLGCAVWMYWSCSAKQLRQNQSDLMMITKLFGIPVILDEGHSSSIVEFLVNQAKSGYVDEDPIDGLFIEDGDMKEFLNIVSRIEVQMDPEANSLLKLYFIVTRSVRPNILSPKSFAILRRFSECHAKLCLRSTVLKTDVVVSISIFERYVGGFFGHEMSSAPVLNCIKQFEEVETFMQQFEQWLNQYLGAAANHANFYREDFNEF